MTNKTLDCRGLACPQPVINTRKVLESLRQESPDFTLTVIVDNLAALKNVTRYAETSGCRVAVKEEGSTYYLSISKPAAAPQEVSAGSVSCCCPEPVAGKDTVLVITGSTLGRGEEELGKLLMRSFFYSLKESGILPCKMLFFNSGVFLTTEGSPVLEELQALADKGVEIYSCGTCLEYYKLKDKLAAGQITNMYDTVTAMLTAGRCLTI